MIDYCHPRLLDCTYFIQILKTWALQIEKSLPYQTQIYQILKWNKLYDFISLYDDIVLKKALLGWMMIDVILHFSPTFLYMS